MYSILTVHLHPWAFCTCSTSLSLSLYIYVWDVGSPVNDSCFLKEYCDGRFRICCSAWPFSHALSIADFVLGSGSRKLVLSDTCIPPRYLYPSNQHGKEGSKEGRSRSPQGDESDEGQEVKGHWQLLCFRKGDRLFRFEATCIWAHACTVWRHL